MRIWLRGLLCGLLLLPGVAAAGDFTFHGCSICSPGCPSMCPARDPPEHRQVNHPQPNPAQPNPEEVAKAKDRAFYNQYVGEFNQTADRWRDSSDSEDEVQEWFDFYNRTGWNSGLYTAAQAAYRLGNLDEAWRLFVKLTDSYDGNPHTVCGDNYDALPGDEFKYDPNPDWSREALCTSGSVYMNNIRQKWADQKLAAQREAEHAAEMKRQREAREAAERLQAQSEALNRKGDEYRNSGHWADAERVYRKSLQMNPVQSKIWTYGLAYVLTKEERWEAAFDAAQNGCITEYQRGVDECPGTGTVQPTDGAYANMYLWTFANRQQARAEAMFQGQKTMTQEDSRHAFALLRDAIKFDAVTGKKHPQARVLLGIMLEAMGRKDIGEMEADIVLLEYPDPDDRAGAQMFLDGMHRKDMEELAATGHPLAHWPNNCLKITPSESNPQDAGNFGCVNRVPRTLPLPADRILVIPQKGGMPASAEGNGESEWMWFEGGWWREIVRLEGTVCQTKKGETITEHRCPWAK